MIRKLIIRWYKKNQHKTTWHLRISSLSKKIFSFNINYLDENFFFLLEHILLSYTCFYFIVRIEMWNMLKNLLNCFIKMYLINSKFSIVWDKKKSCFCQMLKWVWRASVRIWIHDIWWILLFIWRSVDDMKI